MATVNKTANMDHLRDLAARLATQFRAQRVILFGSQAYGQPNESSDVDLLVVTPDPPPKLEAWRLTRVFRDEVGLALHIVFMSTREFEETRDVVGGLAYPAHHWGKVLYAAQP